VRRDTAFSLVDWKPLNDCAVAVIVAIYSMALDHNENVPGIAIGKANASHQKKYWTTGNKIASIPKQDQDERLNPSIEGWMFSFIELTIGAP